MPEKPKETGSEMVERWRDWNNTTMTPLTCANELATFLERLHSLSAGIGDLTFYAMPSCTGRYALFEDVMRIRGELDALLGERVSDGSEK